MSEAAEQQRTEAQGLVVDPFGLQPHVASRITGLGGNAPGHDHTYLFHTDYFEAAEGPCTYTVRFQGLQARQGTLVLRVHMLAMEDGAHARLANSERLALNRLSARGGEAQIRFEGFRNVKYALYGLVPDESDVAADGIAVTLDNPADPEAARAAAAAEARSTRYGTDRVRPTAQLIALEPATFADPVCQLGTAAQLAEPAFAEWARQLGSAGSERDRWRDAYVMQVLRRYGMLQPGARGLGFGSADGPLPGAVAAAGGEVVALTGRDDASEAARDGIERRAGTLAPIAPDLVNFDFLWSTASVELLGSARAAVAFADAAMACLRPGGLAVHVFAFDPESIHRGETEADPLLMERHGIERLALLLISRGHEVAQMKLGDADPLVARGGRGGAAFAGAFGLIARKPRLDD